MHTENIDFVPSNNFNSSETIGQQNSNLAVTDLLQSFQDNFPPSGSFSTPTLEEIATANVIETAIPENFAERISEYNYSPAKDSNFYDEWNHPDSLTGNTAKTLDLDATDSLMKGFSPSEEAVLEVAVSQVQDKLTTFADQKTFFGELNQAFDLDVTSSEARALIEDLATGETMPKIEIVSPTELNNAHGAFGKGFIYLSEKFLSDNISKPEKITGVLLEEIGHFVDQQLSSSDSPGDEGNIFAQLVQGETISGAELTTLKAEDDSALIFLNGKELAVELAENPRQADAQDGWTSLSDRDSPSYPGYNLSYNPSNPNEYDEDPEVVRLWQQRMADLGYEIEVDGYYGEQSAGVAREFQEDNGLKVDGYVGPETWAASFSSTTPTAENPRQADAQDGWTSLSDRDSPSYPGYNLSYNPSNPNEYDEDPEVVRLWQQRMADLGYEIEVDGYYGKESAGVARQFQEDNGLKVDGYVGPETWAASFNSANPSYPGYNLIYNPSAPDEYDEDPEVVRMWQQRMADLGYEIEVDGYYGKESAGVARQFQEDNGLKVDGYVGPETWAASFNNANPSPPSPPSPPPSTSNNGSFKDEIVKIAYQEWETFDRGSLKETEEGAWQRVAGEYWQTDGVDRTDINTSAEVGSDNNPWSAAFISWVMQQAGAGDQFEYSASHSTYITDAIADRSENDTGAAFFGYRLDEYSPEVGDLVSYARQNGVGYDTPAPYKSHSDIVVAKREGEIDVIGGNVSDSVTLKTLKIDSEGKLIDTSYDWFAVLSNRIDESTTQDSGTPSYPGYNLIYDPSTPNEYDENPEVVRLWQQRMADLGYEIEVDGYYGEESAGVARKFQEDNGLKVDGYVGPETWAASFSADATESSSTPSTSPDAVDAQIEAEIEAYESLYVREFYKEFDILATRPEVAETTWIMSAAFPGIPGTGAQEMLKENKDFLKKAAERYGIDGRAIAGAIRWEYEVNMDSRLLDFEAYNQVQDTESLNVEVFGQQLNGNGWGKMHYDTAQKVLEASGEEIPDNQTLATMLALPTSAIDLIARSMSQAVDAYWVHRGEDISNKPEILADLYQSSGYLEKYIDAAQAREGEPVVGNEMGRWVEENLVSLAQYETPGRELV